MEIPLRLKNEIQIKVFSRISESEKLSLVEIIDRYWEVISKIITTAYNDWCSITPDEVIEIINLLRSKKQNIIINS